MLSRHRLCHASVGARQLSLLVANLTDVFLFLLVYPTLSLSPVILDSTNRPLTPAWRLVTSPLLSIHLTLFWPTRLIKIATLLLSALYSLSLFFIEPPFVLSPRRVPPLGRCASLSRFPPLTIPGFSKRYQRNSSR